jgi:hypothetical protein
MAKFNGIKDGDLLIQSLRPPSILYSIIILIWTGIMTFNIAPKAFNSYDAVGITFSIFFGLVFCLFVLVILANFVVKQLLFEGYYLGDRILFKCKEKRKFSTIIEWEDTIYLNDIERFLNCKGDEIDILFQEGVNQSKNLSFPTKELRFSKSYKKNKVDVIDFLNQRIKESRGEK